MALDALVLIYKGANQAFTLLEAAVCETAEWEDTQFGGPGKGTFTFYSTLENAINYLGNNRLDCYLREDMATSGIAQFSLTVPVANYTRFTDAVGQQIAIYDGENFDVAILNDIDTSTGSLILSTQTLNAYDPGANVMVQRYRGYISARTRDADLNSKTTVETAGYQSLLSQAIVTGQITSQECGYTIYQLLALKNPILDINQQPSNFVMSSNGSLSGTSGSGTTTTTVHQATVVQIVKQMGANTLTVPNPPTPFTVGNLILCVYTSPNSGSPASGWAEGPQLPVATYAYKFWTSSDSVNEAAATCLPTPNAPGIIGFFIEIANADPDNPIDRTASQGGVQGPHVTSVAITPQSGNSDLAIFFANSGYHDADPGSGLTVDSANTYGGFVSTGGENSSDFQDLVLAYRTAPAVSEVDCTFNFPSPLDSEYWLTGAVLVNSSTTTTTTPSVDDGTGQLYTGTLSSSQLDETIQEIMVIANANPQGITYSFYYDNLNNVYFQPLNTSTPSKIVNLKYATPGYTDDNYYNLIDKYQVRDYDMSTLINVLYAQGGSDSSGNPITAIVTNDDSIADFGQREGTVSNTSLTTSQMVSAFGVSQINMQSLPLVTSNLNFVVVGDFCTSQDYIEVGGFDDGSTQSFNVQSVTTKYDANNFGEFSQTLILSQIYPDERTIMAQIAAQVYRANAFPNQPHTDVTDRYVQYGLGATITAPETLSLQAGALVCNVTPTKPTNLHTFNIAAQNFTATSDGLWTLGFIYRDLNGLVYQYPPGT